MMTLTLLLAGALALAGAAFLRHAGVLGALAGIATTAGLLFGMVEGAESTAMIQSCVALGILLAVPASRAERGRLLAWAGVLGCTAALVHAVAGGGVEPVLGVESLALLLIPCVMIGVAGGVVLPGLADRARVVAAALGATGVALASLAIVDGLPRWPRPLLGPDGLPLLVFSWREGAGEAALMERMVIHHGLPESLLLMFCCTAIAASAFLPRRASLAAGVVPALGAVFLLLLALMAAPVPVDAELVERFGVIGMGAANVVLHPHADVAVPALGPLLVVASVLVIATLFSLPRADGTGRETAVVQSSARLGAACGLLLAAWLLRSLQRLREGAGPGAEDLLLQLSLPAGLVGLTLLLVGPRSRTVASILTVVVTILVGVGITGTTG
ncbi:MAG: hypothetical protein EA398_04620 [Deltaproteobacteria bacterium]|nr:MAG: hypothetical protein EA398_04620 [Deltaproteobacteria bacterium]